MERTRVELVTSALQRQRESIEKAVLTGFARADATACTNACTRLSEDTATKGLWNLASCLVDLSVSDRQRLAQLLAEFHAERVPHDGSEGCTDLQSVQGDQQTSENVDVSESEGDALAPCLRLAFASTELRELVLAWDKLPSELRRGMLAMVRSVGGGA